MGISDLLQRFFGCKVLLQHLVLFSACDGALLQVRFRVTLAVFALFERTHSHAVNFVDNLLLLSTVHLLEQALNVVTACTPPTRRSTAQHVNTSTPVAFDW